MKAVFSAARVVAVVIRRTGISILRHYPPDQSKTLPMIGEAFCCPGYDGNSPPAFVQKERKT
jgi:hypothetical protein